MPLFGRAGTDSAASLTSGDAKSWPRGLWRSCNILLGLPNFAVDLERGSGSLSSLCGELPPVRFLLSVEFYLWRGCLPGRDVEFRFSILLLGEIDLRECLALNDFEIFRD